jgi:hypothetical protein
MEFSHLDTLVTLDELEKALKLTKTGKSPRQDNINSELHKYAQRYITVETVI